jgi:hypothetical protein
VVCELLMKVQVAWSDLRDRNQLVPIAHRIIDPVVQAKGDDHV